MTFCVQAPPLPSARGFALEPAMTGPALWRLASWIGAAILAAAALFGTLWAFKLIG